MNRKIRRPDQQRRSQLATGFDLADTVEVSHRRTAAVSPKTSRLITELAQLIPWKLTDFDPFSRRIDYAVFGLMKLRHRPQQ
jgi:hypothetical protein